MHLLEGSGRCERDRGQADPQRDAAEWRAVVATSLRRWDYSSSDDGAEKGVAMWSALTSNVEQSAHCQIGDDQQRPWRRFLHFACSDSKDGRVELQCREQTEGKVAR